MQALELLMVLLLFMHQKYTPRTSNGTTCATSNNATFTHSAATTANSIKQPSSFSSCCTSWSHRQEGLEPKIRSSLPGSAPWDQEPLCSLQHSQVPQFNFFHRKKSFRRLQRELSLTKITININAQLQPFGHSFPAGSCFCHNLCLADY